MMAIRPWFLGWVVTGLMVSPLTAQVELPEWKHREEAQPPLGAGLLPTADEGRGGIELRPSGSSLESLDERRRRLFDVAPGRPLPEPGGGVSNGGGATSLVGGESNNPANAPVDLSRYLGQRPLDHLVDPDALLSEQASNDLRRFLEYHAEPASIDLYLVILPAQAANLSPQALNLPNVHQQWFGSEPSVLVALVHGRPELTVVEFGRNLRARVSPEVLRMVADPAAIEAMSEGTPSDQAENVALELSIRSNWLEQVLSRPSGVSEEDAVRQTAFPTDPRLAEPGASSAPKLPSPSVLIGVGVIVGMVGGLLVWWLRRDSLVGKPVFFPRREVQCRLGGKHSGGGCAEVSFALEEGN